jgi:hypothetical protein
MFGVPLVHIVNAAFCHPGPLGGRFNRPERGAWYSAFDLETAIEEVSFHKRHFLQEARIRGESVFEYFDFLADFRANFTSLKPQS